MGRSWKFVFLLPVLALIACHHPDSVYSKGDQIDLGRYQKVHSVSWLHYNHWKLDNPENAVYIMDGLIVGTGRDGYDKLVQKINSLPEWDLVIVYYLNDQYATDNNSGTGPKFPYDDYPVRLDGVEHKATTMNRITAVNRPEGMVLKGYRQP